MEEKQIIGVKYKSRYEDCYEGREYSYYAGKDIQKGDVVIAPTAYGEQEALVTSINLPESKIEAFKDKVKTIEKVVISGKEIEATIQEETANIVKLVEEKSSKEKSLI